MSFCFEMLGIEAAAPVASAWTERFIGASELRGVWAGSGGPRLRVRGPGESVALTPTEPPEPSWKQTLRACAHCWSACRL